LQKSGVNRFLSTGVNFTNVLQVAFVLADPKRTKRHWWLFVLLVSAHVKVALKYVDEIVLKSRIRKLWVYINGYVKIRILNSGCKKGSWLKTTIRKYVNSMRRLCNSDNYVRAFLKKEFKYRVYQEVGPIHRNYEDSNFWATCKS